MDDCAQLKAELSKLKHQHAILTTENRVITEIIIRYEARLERLRHEASVVANGYHELRAENAQLRETIAELQKGERYENAAVCVPDHLG